MLVIVGGLPASGKTTLSRALAGAIGAVHVRIDTIEQAIRDADAYANGDARPVGAAGYVVGYAVARDLLGQGLTVIAESVNPLPVTRQSWRDVARSAGTGCVEVEVVCSDPDEHRRRAAGRTIDIPGLRPPTWAEITTRDYQPWDVPHTVIDTAGRITADCLDELLAALALPAEPDPG